MKNSVLITGGAGFIGFSLSKKLLEQKYKVYSIDNFNDYYSVKIKKDRIKHLKKKFDNFFFKKIDLINFKKLNEFVKKKNIKKIIHLAAQAGVRYSYERPDIYFQSNLLGFFNVIEIARKNNIKEILAASTSSVYGDQNKFPIKENFDTSKPIQFYAATKKSNEVMGYSYYKMFKMNFVFMRFFTVYGPWGRPDMSLYKFTKNILKNKKIDVYNNGKHVRDFTYIDDIIEGIVKILNLGVPKTYNLYNIGSNNPINLMDFIEILENSFGLKAKKEFLPLQEGDMQDTYADISDLEKDFGYRPSTTLEEGIFNFVSWFKEYYDYK